MSEINPEKGKGAILSGQQYDPKKGISIAFTEQKLPYSGSTLGDTARTTGSEGTDGVEITPEDIAAAKVRTYDIAAIQAAILALPPIIWPSRTNVDLPDVLTAVTVTWNKTSGDGASSHPASQQGAASAGSGSSSINPRATAEASAVIVPDIRAEIKRYSQAGRNVPTTNYALYAEHGATESTIASLLSSYLGQSVNLLEVWGVRDHQITATGQQFNVSANADSQATVSSSEDTAAYSYQWGNGYSSQVGATIVSKYIPPTIHDTIAITGDTEDSETATVTVDASTTPMYINAALIIGPIDNTPDPITATAEGRVEPTTLAATTPAFVPTGGLYLTSINATLDDFNLLLVHVEVVDFVIFYNV